VDQLPITNQYQTSYGVTFSLSGGSTPFLEAVGSTDVGNGFINDNLGIADTAAAGFASQLGNYYLRIGTTSLALLAPTTARVRSTASPGFGRLVTAPAIFIALNCRLPAAKPMALAWPLIIFHRPAYRRFRSQVKRFFCFVVWLRSVLADLGRKPHSVYRTYFR
jgi:hypothetical protein